MWLMVTCHLVYSNGLSEKSMKYQPLVLTTPKCYETVRIKRAVSLISPRKGAIFGEQDYPCDLAVSYLKLYGSNQH
ncbi:hypothetical protein BTN50_1310 [Candidatus Enterovibrio altilux]|uniref:Mobile element protein n=1 Tax=Candidatus Enterovibrio altilux TaxID=1927128 RepID=A0A291B9W2_9GAMM|nr:hypothetical protein BTN50_1310 [Candidatus Enterovibrio luxaltus]